MLRQVAFTVVIGVALTCTASLAQDCRVGPGLGSTLLIPYFEVDLGDPAGRTTLFSVNNEFSTPAVARVVLWTDWGIPTLGFDIFLEPRDLATINVRDLFSGSIPSTGDSSDLSEFPFCQSASFTPVHANPALSAAQVNTMQAFHQGNADPTSGMCAGQLFGDNVGRGYITVDVVDECSGIEIGKTFSPADSSFPYFSNGGASNGIAIVSNRLWGDFFLVDPSEDSAQGSEAISLWADSTRFASSDEFTFYGRFEGYTATDERVPLPDLWSSRFLDGGAFTGGTDFIVWRDVGTAEADPIPCGPASKPSWFPLNTSFITA